MRVSIPGVPGVYYDTDSGSTAMGVVLTAAGRKVPKPKGYAIQLLPYIWSFEVDLREVPDGHPIQYLHPESAHSLGTLSADRSLQQAGTDLESLVRFVWSVNQVVESTTNQVLGRPSSSEGVVIEIDDGTVSADGETLETDEFDLETPADQDDNSHTSESTDGPDDSESGSSTEEFDTETER